MRLTSNVNVNDILTNIYDVQRAGGSVVENPPDNAGDVSLIPESGRSSGEGNGNLLQHSCLGNPMDREVWQATVWGHKKSWTRFND